MGQRFRHAARMKQGLWAILAVLILTSCGKDTPEKLIEDKISYLDGITEIIEDVADGGSAADAAEEIEKWKAKGAKLAERQKELIGTGANTNIEAAAELMKEYGPRAGEAMKEMMAAMAKLAKSGRATEELTKAIEGINSN